MNRSKLLLFSLLLSINPVSLYAQRKINITMHRFDCYKATLEKQYKKDALEAYSIMSDLFSSQEFQDSLKKLVFPVSTFCAGCGPGHPRDSTTVSGGSVLDILFARSTDFLNLYMDKSSGANGKTIPCDTLTRAYYDNLYSDMCHLPPPVRLAVNLCHEYFHHIGFCHQGNPKDKTLRKMVINDGCRTEYFDPNFYKNDVAYRVGWIAYDILNKQYGTPVPTVQKN